MSNTTTQVPLLGGLISPAPRWQLGEMGTVINDKMNSKVENLDQLNLFLQRNEADLIYGARMMYQIESILKDVRANGISKDVAVAVESVRPGTIPKGVRQVLTSNYSRTHQKETVVALESWAKFGRIGLISMLLVALLKIVNWLISNSKAYGGVGDANGANYAESVAGLSADDLPDGSVLNSLNISTVRQCYHEEVKKLKGSRMSDFNLTIAFMDRVLSDLNAEEYLNTLADALGYSPFKELIAGYAKKPVKSDSRVTLDIVETLLNFNVTSAVFKEGVHARRMLPEKLKKMGIIIPDIHVFVNQNRGAGGYAPVLRGLDSVFKHTLTYWDDLVAGFKDGRYKKFVDKENDNHLRLQRAEMVTAELGKAVANAALFFDMWVSPPPRPPDNNYMLPTVAPDNVIRNLVGWMEIITFPGPGGMTLATPTYSSFLNSTGFALANQKSQLSNEEVRGVLATILELKPERIDKQYIGQLSHLENFTDCSGYIKEMIASMTEFSKKARGQSPEVYEFFNAGLMMTMTEGVPMPDGSNPAAELSQLFLADVDDFFAGMKNFLTAYKGFGQYFIALQTVLNRSTGNPFIKKA